MKKRIFGIILVVTLSLSMSVCVFATDHGNPTAVKATIQTYSVVGAPNN